MILRRGAGEGRGPRRGVKEEQSDGQAMCGGEGLHV